MLTNAEKKKKVINQLRVLESAFSLSGEDVDNVDWKEVDDTDDTCCFFFKKKKKVQ